MLCYVYCIYIMLCYVMLCILHVMLCILCYVTSYVYMLKSVNC